MKKYYLYFVDALVGIDHLDDWHWLHYGGDDEPIDYFDTLEEAKAALDQLTGTAEKEWWRDAYRVKGYIVGEVRETIRDEGEEEETVLLCDPVYWTKLEEV